jgi:LCP family protein required for cell wall assembly
MANRSGGDNQGEDKLPSTNNNNDNRRLNRRTNRRAMASEPLAPNLDQRNAPRWPDPTQIQFSAEQPPTPSNRPSNNNRGNIGSGNNNSGSNRKNGGYQPLGQTSRPSRWSNDKQAGYDSPVSPNNNVPLQPPSQFDSPQRRPRASQKQKSPRRSLSIGKIAIYGFLALLVIGVLVALFVFTRIDNFTKGITVQRVDVNNNPISGSNFNGHDSVNIALLGLDTRPGNPDGTRSDTIIIVRINPQTKAASMLSIPRDLWVDIPGNGKNRINAAYTFGDAAHPGSGGPPLVEATIKQNFGINIDYFAQIDFEDFEQVIDAIGGVIIDVPKPLIDDEFPTLDYGFKRVYIPAGIQHMDGKTAVEYARSRHADSDTGRNQRQQQVLTAIREQGVNLGLLTNTQVQTALQRAIRTDMNTGDIFGLAQIAIGMNKANIHNFSIDYNLAIPTDIEAGNVLMPQWDGIRNLVTTFMNSTNQAQPDATPTATPAASVNIKVLNGTFVEGRAAQTQTYLESKGFKVLAIGQAADAGKYPTTVVYYYNGKQAAALNVAAVLGVSSANVQSGTNGSANVDVEVVCGNDLRLPAS